MSKKDKKLFCYEYLKEKIINNSLTPGEPINEVDFLEMLKVSRTPFREALIQLENEDFVGNLTGKGFFVAHISISDIKEFFELREILECGAMKRVAVKADKDILLDVKKEFMEIDATTHLSRKGYFKAGDKIHFAVFELLENSKALNAYKKIQEHIIRIRNFIYNRIDEERSKQSFEEHIEIIDSLISGDPIRAEAAMVNHLHNSMRYQSMVILNNN